MTQGPEMIIFTKLKDNLSSSLTFGHVALYFFPAPWEC